MVEHFPCTEEIRVRFTASPLQARVKIIIKWKQKKMVTRLEQKTQDGILSKIGKVIINYLQMTSFQVDYIRRETSTSTRLLKKYRRRTVPSYSTREQARD